MSRRWWWWWRRLFCNFIGLTDTPSSLTADKFLAVNAAGNGIELVDAPAGGGGGGGGGGSALTISRYKYNCSTICLTNTIR